MWEVSVKVINRLSDDRWRAIGHDSGQVRRSTPLSVLRRRHGTKLISSARRVPCFTLRSAVDSWFCLYPPPTGTFRLRHATRAAITFTLVSPALWFNEQSAGYKAADERWKLPCYNSKSWLMVSAMRPGRISSKQLSSLLLCVPVNRSMNLNGINWHTSYCLHMSLSDF